jgi:exodeoxyribonuclease VIII
MTATQMQMSNESYHKDTTAISSSGLKLIAKSAKSYFVQYLDETKDRKEPTPAMEFGTLVHALVLEPETVESLYAIMPEGIDKRTTEGKRLWAEWIEKNGTKKVVKSDDMKTAKEISNAIFEHPLSSIIKKKMGVTEFTLFWDEEIEISEGIFKTVKCKARLDYAIIPNPSFPYGLIIDVKTCQDAGDDFAKSAYNFGYHIQAAFYCRAIQKAYELDYIPQFVFLAAEKEEPYLVASHKASDDFLSKGWIECIRLLKIYAQSKHTGVWEGLSTETKELDLPRYAKENYV